MYWIVLTVSLDNLPPSPGHGVEVVHEVRHVLSEVLRLAALAPTEGLTGCEGAAQGRPLARHGARHRQPGQGAEVALHQVHLPHPRHPLDVEPLPGQGDGGGLT